MASINDEQILITFEELRHLEIEDIALCIDKYQALSICGKSGSAALDIYNLWVNKLFKAYDISEYKDEDWLQILGYLEEILDKFILNCPETYDDSASKLLNHWWMDTMELLQWLQTIIDKLDKRILAVILAFGLDIIVKTCEIANKRNIQPILKMQKQLLHLLSSHMFKMDLGNTDDFISYNKVLTSLCDVGSFISSSDIKLSIETWRVVAKMSTKCNESYNYIDNASKETIKDLKRNWTEKPLLAIIIELHKLFRYFLDDDTAQKNDNFLKVAQFYVKLVKVIIKNTSAFPAVKEYMEVYIVFVHKLNNRSTNQVFESIQEDLNEILAFIYHDAAVQNYLCQHLLDDNKEFGSCNLILEYMRISFDKYRKHLPDVKFLNRIFDILFDGPLIFIDGEKYQKVVMYYATLATKDVTGQLHMLWCKRVLESPWIKACVSCEILRTYYGYIFKSSHENVKICLEFWINCWQKYNVSSYAATAFNHRRFLIEMIIKSVVSQLPQDIIEQCFNNCTNLEIILLKCGKDNVKLLCNLNTNLTNNFKKIREMHFLRREYTELLNFMDIWCCHPQYINTCAVKDDFFKAFHKIFSLPLVEMIKFRDFLNKSFCVFKTLNDIVMDDTILKCLLDNLNKTKTLVGAFLLEYLLKQTPQSDQLIKSLETIAVIKLQNYLANTAPRPGHIKSKDLKIFQDLYIKSQNKSNQAVLYDVHISKRPRVGEACDFADYKFILNEMFEHSHQLLNSTTTVFDNKDYELLNCIKHNIDGCLIKY